MARRITFAEGEYYHVYNRGVDKRDIFLEDQDYQRFVRLLYLSNGGKSFDIDEILQSGDLSPQDFFSIDRNQRFVSIGAYCLMTNHFHLLVKAKSDSGVSQFMQKLSTAYTMYFNTKYARSGALFQGRFKAQHVDNDEYLKYLYAYIHLNPIKSVDEGWGEHSIHNRTIALTYLSEFPHSSYRDYQREQRPESSILTVEDFPEYFSKKGSFDTYVRDWINLREVQPPVKRRREVGYPQRVLP